MDSGATTPTRSVSADNFRQEIGRSPVHLIYNHADSHPDPLGLKVLRELREVDNWNAILDRIESLVPIPEQRKPGEHSSMAEAEIRRAFPDLEYRGSPQNFYDLYQPLQGTLKPYLDGKLMFMPDASDFIHNSLHCEWAYIANLDSDKFEVWKGLQTKPDPDIYARVDRAKTRLAVLKEVAEERYFETEPLTATRIKKLMREHHPLGINHVLAALQFLEEHDLVEVVDRTDKRDLKIYDVTNLGRSVSDQLCGE